MTPHHAFPDVTWADVRTELLRELTSRRSAYPRMVSKGQMMQQDADRQIDIFQAILEDHRRFRDARAPIEQGKPGLNPLQVERASGSSLHAYTWHERRTAITRELDRRQEHYPRWIQKGQLTQDAADLQICRLECMRALYELGWDWRPESGAWPHWSSIDPTEQEYPAREEWMAIEAEIAARSGVAQQEMAL